MSCGPSSRGECRFSDSDSDDALTQAPRGLPNSRDGQIVSGWSSVTISGPCPSMFASQLTIFYRQ
jgi:hypothetical protein